MELKKRSLKQMRYLMVPILILFSIFLYFYMSYFFQPGIEYYGRFLPALSQKVSASGTVYEGKTEEGTMTLKTVPLSGEDIFIEIQGEDVSSEYLYEGSAKQDTFRLFDGSNQLLLNGEIRESEGEVLVEGESISLYSYEPLKDGTYGEKNPEPLLMVFLAEGLLARNRGTMPVLFLGGLILLSLLVDILFPDFFFRMKNLKFKGDIEVPELYRSMQKVSWVLTPFLLMGFLYFSI